MTQNCNKNMAKRKFVPKIAIFDSTKRVWKYFRKTPTGKTYLIPYAQVHRSYGIIYFAGMPIN